MPRYAAALRLVPLPAALLAGCVQAPPLEPVRFTVFQPDLFAEGGALTDAWADVDGDGDPDRFVGFNGAPSRLYRNDRDGGFAEVAGDLGLAVDRAVRTSAWGDYDADGDPDLFLGFAGEGPVTALYRNDGDRFVEVAESVGLQLAEGTTRQASWIDFDEDGDLDLFLALRDRENRLFRNDGALGFQDVTDEAGIGNPARSVGAVWFDRGDGGLDLVVANMDGDANTMWIRSEGTFAAYDGEGALAGGGRPVGVEELGSVRPCAFDYDNDGDFDLSFANYGPNGLLEQRPDGTYADVAPELGLAIDSRFDTCAWADFDHDGRGDVYVNGTVTGGVQYRDWLLRREGGAAFVDVTPAELLELNADHGATWVDFDLDGDLDLSLVGVGDDGMHYLMENHLRPEVVWHSLQVRVLDRNGRATMPGTEVRAYAAGTDRLLGLRLVDTGSGYDAQSDLPVHFGLPGGQPVDIRVTVLGGGGRHVGTVAAVDPAEYQGRVLTIRIDRQGTVVP